MRVLENGTYKCFNGRYYFVSETNIKNVLTNERLVVYFDDEGNTYAVPYDNFCAKVNQEIYPEATQEWIFERVNFYIQHKNGKYLDFYDEFVDTTDEALEFSSDSDAERKINPNDEDVELGYINYNPEYCRCKVVEVIKELESK